MRPKNCGSDRRRGDNLFFFGSKAGVILGQWRSFLIMSNENTNLIVNQDVLVATISAPTIWANDLQDRFARFFVTLKTCRRGAERVLPAT
jgi:hypothetical protein